MPVTTTKSSRTFAGTGALTPYPCDFRIFLPSDVSVSLVDPVSGSSTPLMLDVDYSITGQNNEAGFTLNTVAAVPVGKNLYIFRNIGYTQPTSLTNQSSFFPIIHQDIADRLEMQIQQVAEAIARSLTYPGGLSPTFTGQLPIPLAGSLLGWAPDASSLVNVGSSGVGAGVLLDSNINANAGISGTKLAFLQAGTNATTRNVQDKLRERFSVKDFGATGLGVADDSAAIQRAFTAAKQINGATVYFPSGKYLINTTVTVDLTGHTVSGDSKGINIQGDGSGNTQIINATNNVGIDVVGSMNLDNYSSLFRMKGVAITKVGAGTGDIGLRVSKVFYGYYEDVSFFSNTLGTRFTDVVATTYMHCTWKFNTYGMLGAGQVDPVGSTPNGIWLVGCVFYGQANYGWWMEGGCNIVMLGGTIETTSGGTDAQRFGCKINNPGTYGGASAAFYGTYFERNGNTADVWINNGDFSTSCVFSGCTFNRLLSTEFSVNNILLQTNNNVAARVTLAIEGCAFSQKGTYVASASRKYVAVTGSTPVTFRDVGNMWANKVEKPVFPSLDALARGTFTGAGAVFRATNISSVGRTGVGAYTINFIDSSPDITSGRTVNAFCDVTGFSKLTGETATSVSLAFFNTSGTAVDPGIISVVVYE